MVCISMCTVTWDVMKQVQKCWIESFDGLNFRMTHTSPSITLVNFSQFCGHSFTTNMLKRNFDIKDFSFCSALQVSFCVSNSYARENIVSSFCIFTLHKHTNTHAHIIHTYTHTLPTWLLGEMTRVGVLCFCYGSKDNLESMEMGLEWEQVKCKKDS